MKKQASSAADPSEIEPPSREKMTRREYVESLREHYLKGTLDDVLGADMDIPDSLVEAIYPEMYDGGSVY